MRKQFGILMVIISYCSCFLEPNPTCPDCPACQNVNGCPDRKPAAVAKEVSYAVPPPVVPAGLAPTPVGAPAVPAVAVPGAAAPAGVAPVPAGVAAVPAGVAVVPSPLVPAAAVPPGAVVVEATTVIVEVATTLDFYSKYWQGQGWKTDDNGNVYVGDDNAKLLLIQMGSYCPEALCKGWFGIW